jgi:hypothetical protein
MKTLHYIRNKKELQELYLSQMPESHIRAEINEILNQTRTSIPLGMRIHLKNITTKEAIIFIEQNGTPDGYTLSDELQLKLKEYRETLRSRKTEGN